MPQEEIILGSSEYPVETQQDLKYAITDRNQEGRRNIPIEVNISEKLEGEPHDMVDVSGVTITGTFRSSSINLIDFNLCKLSNVNFLNCNLYGVMFEECEIDNCNFKGTKLTETSFQECKISGMIISSDTEFQKVYFYYNTGLDKIVDEKGNNIDEVDLGGRGAEIAELETEPVREKVIPRVKANLNSKVDFYDPITMDKFNGTIEEHIDEDINNVVIVYQKKKEGKLVDEYFLTNRNTIEATYNNNENTVYPCKKTSSIALIPKEENIIDKPFFDLQKLGFVEANQQYCDMKQYDDNKNNQLFAIVNLDKKYPSFVSHYVRYDPNVDVVSEQHCQAGQDGSVCKLIVATPSAKENPNGDLQYGGVKSKKSKSKKTQKRKHNKKKQTIKKKINKKTKGKKNTKK